MSMTAMTGVTAPPQLISFGEGLGFVSGMPSAKFLVGVPEVWSSRAASSMSCQRAGKDTRHVAGQTFNDRGELCAAYSSG